MASLWPPLCRYPGLLLLSLLSFLSLLLLPVSFLNITSFNLFSLLVHFFSLLQPLCRRPNYYYNHYIIIITIFIIVIIVTIVNRIQNFLSHTFILSPFVFFGFRINNITWNLTHHHQYHFHHHHHQHHHRLKLPTSQIVSPSTIHTNITTSITITTIFIINITTIHVFLPMNTMTTLYYIPLINKNLRILPPNLS